MGVSRNSRRWVHRSTKFTYPCILLLSATALFFYLLKSQVDFVSRKKTIAGHNLDPTPWHLFPPKTFQEGNNRFSRASKIYQCSHLTCTSSSSSSKQHRQKQNISYSCPPFFQWIHHDLAPWRRSRITPSNIAEARKLAAFRVVIVEGRLYADLYYDCVQSRAMFTIWGILQLLRRYPGMVPDLDLMFDCMDKPSVNASDYGDHSGWPPPPSPPPLFRYCTTDDHLDIPFPDWSFWGWPEINVGSWDGEFKSIKIGSRALKWTEKHSSAYWKGNPDVQSPIRTELLLCNDSEAWGAQIMRQDWVEEARAGFEQSKLSNQCNHKYKIYAEGYAWSVSLKYILSCGSLALIISPQYYDFFSRGLIPKVNYWPVRTTNLCQSIKFAVDWGNEHPMEAESIGRKGQDFMQELDMGRIYDYMFHLLVEYSKLQDFRPSIPPSAQEICEENLLCFADAKQRSFLARSTASSSYASPCSFSPANDKVIKKWMREKQETISGIQELEERREIIHRRLSKCS